MKALTGRIASALKCLFQKTPAPTLSPQPAPPSEPVRPAAHVTHVTSAPAPVVPPAPDVTGRNIELPLEGILRSLPRELQAKVLMRETNGLKITVSLERLLSQLHRGVVKISFGELRQAAPQLFAPGTEYDQALVPLPLGEILARLDPSLIQRRQTRRQADVPPENVASPFEMLNRNASSTQGGAHPVSSSRQESISPPPAAPVPAIPASRASILSTSPLTPPGMTPVSTATQFTGRRMSAPPEPPLQMAATVEPAAQAPKAGAPCDSGDSLIIGLALLMETWPEAIRKEMIDQNLISAKVLLPRDVVEQSLKQGRIGFSWKTLRSWLRPAPGSLSSQFDSTMLELPLKIITPLFLAKTAQAGSAKRRVEISDEIPDLFFGSQKAEPVPAPLVSPGGNGTPAGVGGIVSAKAATPSTAAPVAGLPTSPTPVAGSTTETNFYARSASSNTTRMFARDVPGSSSSGTRFITKSAIPNDVVQRAAAIEGVAGALICLSDGLLVAAQLPPNQNSDTLAAFVPQIYSRMSQSTKELRMGELNNLHFTVGNTPWKIFRINSVFFAIFGRPGVPLPGVPLATLASELEHKPK